MKFTARQFDNNPDIIRLPDQDFKDDGSTFKMYAYKHDDNPLRFSYTTDKNHIYICFYMDIPWTFIDKNFPEFFTTKERLNGISQDLVDAKTIMDTIHEVWTKLNREVIPSWNVEKDRVMNPQKLQIVASKYQERAQEIQAFLDEVNKKITLDFMTNPPNRIFVHRIMDFYIHLKNEIQHLLHPTDAMLCYARVVEVLWNQAAGKSLSNGSYWIDELKKIIDGTC